jgi:pyridoxal 5'-phosphate synthase pdxT subunit
MVNRKLSIGVIGIQGAVSEHAAMMKRVFSTYPVDGSVQVIKPSDSLNGIDGIILPGGESTTISRVLQSSGLSTDLKKRAVEGSLAIMGTCAGCILLATDLIDNNKDVNLLELMSMQVRRNAYGRQRESFEQYIDISSLSSSIKNDSLFPAVFIRAPVIERVWGQNTKVLALDASKRPIMVQQGNCLALTFHPELSNDLRIHQYFLSLVKSVKDETG